jgi:hypothetical protein
MPEFSDQEVPRGRAARWRRRALAALALALMAGWLVLYARGWRFDLFGNRYW